MFNVNEGLLQPTSFFAKHGRYCRQSSSSTSKAARQLKADPSDELNGEGMFVSDKRSPTVEPGNDNTAPIDLTAQDADFVLKGEFYFTREAFKRFVRSLNDAPPIKPKTEDDCKSYLQAYALAQHYDFEPLQNQVIDALQSFYGTYMIPITDIMYLIEHWGDKIDCFLASYLVAQAAFEMASNWEMYRANNQSIEELFASGKKVILEQLFQNAMLYMKSNAKGDPSKDRRSWRFANV